MNSPTPSPGAWMASYLALTGLLIRRREQLGISQQELADRLGIGRRTLQRWEHGEAEPPAVQLFRWAAELDVTLAPHVAHISTGDVA